MLSLPTHVARRTFLRNSGVGLGSMALTSLLASQSRADQTGQGLQVPHWNGVLNPPHFEPKAKRVIWLYMAGGMTHIDTFDNKPKLAELNGKEMPESVTKGQQISDNCKGRNSTASHRNIPSGNGANQASRLQKSGRCLAKNVPTTCAS